MGGFFLPPIWVLIGSHWSLRSLHFKIPWRAIWLGRMVALMGGVPRWGEEGSIHKWLIGCGWWARSWEATCKFMISGSRRLDCAGCSWKSLAITWQTLFLRVGGWILASLSSIEYGCMVLIWFSYHSLCLHHMIDMMEVWGGSKMSFCFACFWESKRKFALTLCMMLQEEEMELSLWYLMMTWKHFQLGKYSIFFVALLEEYLIGSMSNNIVLYWQGLICIISQRCHFGVETYGWSVPSGNVVDP